MVTNARNSKYFNRVIMKLLNNHALVNGLSIPLQKQFKKNTSACDIYISTYVCCDYRGFFLSLILYDNIIACTDLPEEESCEEHGAQSSSFSNGSNTVKIPSKLGI